MPTGLKPPGAIPTATHLAQKIKADAFWPNAQATVLLHTLKCSDKLCRSIRFSVRLKVESPITHFSLVIFKKIPLSCFTSI